jgi:hypothetical protein
LEADIYVFEQTSDLDDRGYFKLRHHTRVTMAFRGVDELSLDRFNNQNVVFDLILTDISSRQLEALRWSVSFESSYGLAGSFLCEKIEVVRVESYEREGPGAGPGRRSPALALSNVGSGLVIAVS